MLNCPSIEGGTSKFNLSHSLVLQMRKQRLRERRRLARHLAAAQVCNSSPDPKQRGWRGVSIQVSKEIFPRREKRPRFHRRSCLPVESRRSKTREQHWEGAWKVGQAVESATLGTRPALLLSSLSLSFRMDLIGSL